MMTNESSSKCERIVNVIRGQISGYVNIHHTVDSFLTGSMFINMSSLMDAIRIDDVVI